MRTEKDIRRFAPGVQFENGPHLFVVIEGGRPRAGGMRASLQDVDEVTIGRGHERRLLANRRELSLELPDRKLSETHARLVRRSGSWRIQDQASTNGTFVNGCRMTEHVLSEGDTLVCGQTVMRFRLDLPTPAHDTSAAEGPAAMGLSTLLPALAFQLGSLARLAPTKLPILLLGDTGTGKEVLARAIHAASGRQGPFVAVNCGALASGLVEAQLFGHTRGAFSGAVRDEAGFVRTAARGTLFLDEVGDLPAGAQAALLRVLQEGEVTAVGNARSAKVDVRVVAATHQPVDQMQGLGTFRSDLFARLAGFTHRLCPLAARREDIGLIVAHHLPLLMPPPVDDVTLTAEAAYALVAYAWPLNVRELVHAIARAVSLAHDGVIGIEHLPPALAAISLAGQASSQPANLSPEDSALRAELTEHLERHQGNVSAVARELGKATMQLYRLMHRLGVDPKQHR